MRRISLIFLAAAALAGCAMPSPARPVRPVAPVATVPELDNCADRLHDIAGMLLEYYVAHRDLPERLEDMNEGRVEPMEFVCPRSNKPYVYDYEGVPLPGRGDFLIVWDAAPVHGGTRLGIAAEPPRPGKPIIVRLVRPPESILPAQPAPIPAGPDIAPPDTNGPETAPPPDESGG